jgi:hypothetical protein
LDSEEVGIEDQDHVGIIVSSGTLSAIRAGIREAARFTSPRPQRAAAPYTVHVTPRSNPFRNTAD